MSESEIVKQAYLEATQVRKNAYARYSQFLVGSCLKAKGSSTLSSGCNFENASFGAGACAERSALSNWISKEGAGTIEFIVVVTDTDPAASPCGICRQSLREFSDENTMVYMANLKGIQNQVKLVDLIPHSFGPEDLKV